jgi:hypothetical protein
MRETVISKFKINRQRSKTLQHTLALVRWAASIEELIEQNYRQNVGCSRIVKR